MHGGAGFLDFVQQNFGAAQGQLLFILADGRQAGNAVLSESDAVIARNGDVLRDAQTVILQGAYGTQRHNVRHGKHSGNIRGLSLIHISEPTRRS